ncbi:MAG: hypothetical protein M1819_006793 [Sarea resinae]|nr:MAG: hypothetical protein M1819_006793 [Sarea resinae]
MGDRVDFDLNESLKHYLSDPAAVPTSEADSALLDCEDNPESLTNALINGVLNPIVDGVAENPEAITRASSFDSLQFLLKCAPTIPKTLQEYQKEPESELFQLSRATSQIPTHALSKVFDLVSSGLSAEADLTHNDIEADEQDVVQHHKRLLEIYGFLMQWAISAVEVKAAEKPATASAARGRGAGKNAKTKQGAKDGSWDASAQIQVALDIMCKVLKLKLAKIFVTTSERDTFVNLFTRPAYLILENEARVKSTSIRMYTFKVLCIAVKHHGHAFGTSNKMKI